MDFSPLLRVFYIFASSVDAEATEVSSIMPHDKIFYWFLKSFPLKMGFIRFPYWLLFYF